MFVCLHSNELYIHKLVYSAPVIKAFRYKFIYVYGVIAFVRKHYTPEGGQNISTAKCDTNLRMTPFMYIYISIWGDICSQNFKPKF